MKKINFILVLIMLLAVGITAGASVVTSNNIKEKCLIATPSWPDRTGADGKGYYFDIMRAVYEPVGYKVEYEIVPWKRAVLMVQNGDADLMLGWFYNPESPEAARFVKWPFDLEETVAVYKKSSVDKWAGQKTMENQKVIWPRGYNYHKFLEVKVDWSETDDLTTGLSMLALDRTKFFMAGKNGIATFKPPIDKTIYEVQVAIQNGLLPYFSKTANGQKLSEIYEQRMPLLLKSGELKKIYEKYGKTMPDLKPRK